MVIELTGLPGAGKTTICSQITFPHRSKRSISMLELRPRLAMAGLVWHLALLCANVRPFSWQRMRLSLGLLGLLRCYTQEDRPVVLEHGLLQKIWSILIDSESYSKALVELVVSDLKPFAPNYLVWVETPLETAALRISQRTHGNSRFDRLPLGDISLGLSARARLLEELTELYHRHTGVEVVYLDGCQSAKYNGLKIEELLRLISQ